jgi:uncharacterized ion transporter superfamily protein YfcC
MMKGCSKLTMPIIISGIVVILLIVYLAKIKNADDEDEVDDDEDEVDDDEDEVDDDDQTDNNVVGYSYNKSGSLI